MYRNQKLSHNKFLCKRVAKRFAGCKQNLKSRIHLLVVVVAEKLRFPIYIFPKSYQLRLHRIATAKDFVKRHGPDKVVDIFLRNVREKVV